LCNTTINRFYISEQSWELFSKALKDHQKNKAKNANNQEKNMEPTKNVPSVENVNKRKSDGNTVSENKKYIKEIEVSESLKTEKSLQKENKIMAKKLAKKQAQQKKKNMIKAEWQSVIQSVITEVGNNEALVNDLESVRNAPNIPLETKWSCLIRPNFMVRILAILNI
jgi:N-acetylmuramoyl-L-alanine amidase CwlA